MLRIAMVHAMLSLPGLHAGDEALAADLKTLQGTWKGWVVEGKGEQSDRGPVQLEITVDKDTITARRLGGSKIDPLGEGTFRLVLADKQKTIDATRTSAPAKGRTHPGIYALDGDTFRWCVANSGNERPAELITRRGQFLLILKRQPVKAEK